MCRAPNPVPSQAAAALVRARSVTLRVHGKAMPRLPASAHSLRLLMSFVGSGNTPFKAKLLDACRRLGPGVCGLIDADNGFFPQPEHPQAENGEGWTGQGSETLLRTLRLRRSSIFCLEPPGHSAGRKSQIDAILSGCIPVLFFSKETYDQFLPLHFGWKDHASVRVDFEAAMSGTYSLERELSAQLAGLNRSGAARPMQRAIARHGRSLVYGLDGGHYPGDAVSTLVSHLAAGLAAPHHTCRKMLPAWRCADAARRETIPARAAAK